MAEHIRLKVFVSSVMRGSYGEFRRAARDAIEALQQQAVVVGLTVPAQDAPSQQACDDAVAECDIVIFLLGKEYGYVDNGKSATHQEWDKARELGKAIFVFKEDIEDADIEPPQQGFIEEVGNFQTGRLWARFRTPEDVLREVVAALSHHDTTSSSSEPPRVLESLPPSCREHIEVVRSSNPTLAQRLLSLVASPSARQPDVVARMIDEPPDWLQAADYAAWEVLAKFVDAYDLEGGDTARERSLELGSPNAVAIRAELAGTQFDSEDLDAARQITALMPADHPLTVALNSMFDDEPEAVIDQVQTSRLHLSEDREIALQAIMLLRWSYFKLEEFDAARQMLRRTNERFTGRASLVYHQGIATLALVEQRGIDAAGSDELLSSALSEMLQARDIFREWDGPSSKAVALAMQAALAMGNPDRAAELGTSAPDGEATEDESSFGDVQMMLAHACLMLGESDRIDTLNFEAVDHQDIVYVQAMQAHAVGDEMAPQRMRNAVNEAEDEPALKRALLGLALCGETDETRAASLPEPDIALLRAVAAIHRQEFEQAMKHLAPHRVSTVLHADCHARAQMASDDAEGAASTLIDAAENLNADSLRVTATECLVQAGQLSDAEQLAQDLLARISSSRERRQLRRLLVHIAEEKSDWLTVEARARALHEEFPHDPDAPWSIVYALHRQVLNRKAWAFRVSHDLVPSNGSQASLSIAVSGGAGMAHEEQDEILQLGERFRDSEEASGTALLALWALGEDSQPTDEQIRRAQALLEDHVTRFPESSLVQQRTFQGPSDMAEQMTESARQRAVMLLKLGLSVRHAMGSYGQLAKILGESYTDVQLNRAAGGMAAISIDAHERQQELIAASDALRSAVAVDTSAIVLNFWINSDFPRLAAAFEGVLLAEDLLFDGRVALQKARLSPMGSFVYDVGSGQRFMQEYSDDERAAMRERPAQLLEWMEACQIAHSASIRLTRDDSEEDPGHWDAAIRVAQSRNIPLWCDDLALRRFARENGVASFGTWALYEALVSSADWAWLPEVRDFQLALLGAQVADVPVLLFELVRQARNDPDVDIGIAALLRRPYEWAPDATNTMAWFLHRVTYLSEHENGKNIPNLLYSACMGKALTVDDDGRVAVVSKMLATTINTIGETADTRRLVAAARYAMNELTLGDGPDPLPSAMADLLSGRTDG